MTALVPRAIQALFPSEGRNVGYPFFRANRQPDFSDPAKQAVNAWWCSQLMWLAYLEDKPFIASILAGAGLQLRGSIIDDGVMQAFVATSLDGTAYVAIRGTVFLAPTWPLDLPGMRTAYYQWKANLEARLVPAAPVPDLPNAPPLQGRVHDGFQKMLHRIAAQVQPLLDALPHASTVVYTGHSLAGAVATLLSHVLVPPQGSKPLIVSFGSPRPGDQALVDCVRTPHWRYVHGNDIVPTQPPAHLFDVPTGYAHHAEPIPLPHESSSARNAIELVDQAIGGLTDMQKAEARLALELAPGGVLDHVPVLYAGQCERRIAVP